MVKITLENITYGKFVFLHYIWQWWLIAYKTVQSSKRENAKKKQHYVYCD